MDTVRLSTPRRLNIAAKRVVVRPATPGKVLRLAILLVAEVALFHIPQGGLAECGKWASWFSNTAVSIAAH